MEGLNAGYANAGYMGFPVCLALFGRESFPLVTLAALLTVSVLFAAAIVCIEVGLQEEAHARAVARRVARSLLTNPLVLSPLIGVAWATLHVPVPVPLHTFLAFLGGAASPCALVSLGLFLSQDSRRQGGAGWLVGTLTVLKLLAQPAITAWVAIPVLHLETRTASIAILLAALPTGTGPFMLAEYYQREALVTSKTILWTTALSIVTLALLIHTLA